MDSVSAGWSAPADAMAMSGGDCCIGCGVGSLKDGRGGETVGGLSSRLRSLTEAPNSCKDKEEDMHITAGAVKSKKKNRFESHEGTSTSLWGIKGIVFFVFFLLVLVTAAMLLTKAAASAGVPAISTVHW